MTSLPSSPAFHFLPGGHLVPPPSVRSSPPGTHGAYRLAGRGAGTLQRRQSTACSPHAIVPTWTRIHLLGRLTSPRCHGWRLRSGPTSKVGATFSPCRSTRAGSITLYLVRLPTPRSRSKEPTHLTNGARHARPGGNHGRSPSPVPQDS